MEKDSFLQVVTEMCIMQWLEHFKLVFVNSYAWTMINPPPIAGSKVLSLNT